MITLYAGHMEVYSRQHRAVCDAICKEDEHKVVIKDIGMNHESLNLSTTTTLQTTTVSRERHAMLDMSCSQYTPDMTDGTCPT